MTVLRVGRLRRGNQVRISPPPLLRSYGAAPLLMRFIAARRVEA